MRRLALFALVPLLSLVSPGPERVLLYTGAVHYPLDSIATVSALRHREEGACVTRWAVSYGENTRTYYVLAIGKADVAGQDTASIAWLVCPDSQPPIHTHVKLTGGRLPYAASPQDEYSIAHTHAPFGLILVAGTSTIVLYGVRP